MIGPAQYTGSGPRNSVQVCAHKRHNFPYLRLPGRLPLGCAELLFADMYLFVVPATRTLKLGRSYAYYVYIEPRLKSHYLPRTNLFRTAINMRNDMKRDVFCSNVRRNDVASYPDVATLYFLLRFCIIIAQSHVYLPILNAEYKIPTPPGLINTKPRIQQEKERLEFNNANNRKKKR